MTSSAQPALPLALIVDDADILYVIADEFSLNPRIFSADDSAANRVSLVQGV